MATDDDRPENRLPARRPPPATRTDAALPELGRSSVEATQVSAPLLTADESSADNAPVDGETGNEDGDEDSDEDFDDFITGDTVADIAVSQAQRPGAAKVNNGDGRRDEPTRVMPHALMSEQSEQGGLTSVSSNIDVSGVPASADLATDKTVVHKGFLADIPSNPHRGNEAFPSATQTLHGDDEEDASVANSALFEATLEGGEGGEGAEGDLQPPPMGPSSTRVPEDGVDAEGATDLHPGIGGPMVSATATEPSGAARWPVGVVVLVAGVTVTAVVIIIAVLLH